MIDRRRVPTLLLIAGLSLLPLSCGKKEKPNANRDMRRDQQRLLNDMDRIAADLEKEKQKQPPAPNTEPGIAPPTPAGEKPNTPPTPSPKDGGGK